MDIHRVLVDQSAPGPLAGQWKRRWLVDDDPFLLRVCTGVCLRIAYMDVAQVGAPNSQTVVILHGGSYYSPYRGPQIEALTEARFRVIAKDWLRWGSRQRDP